MIKRVLALNHPFVDQKEEEEWDVVKNMNLWSRNSEQAQRCDAMLATISAKRCYEPSCFLIFASKITEKQDKNSGILRFVSWQLLLYLLSLNIEHENKVRLRELLFGKSIFSLIFSGLLLCT